MYYSPPGNDATAGWPDDPERAVRKKAKARTPDGWRTTARGLARTSAVRRPKAEGPNLPPPSESRVTPNKPNALLRQGKESRSPHLSIGDAGSKQKVSGRQKRWTWQVIQSPQGGGDRNQVRRTHQHGGWWASQPRHPSGASRVVVRSELAGKGGWHEGAETQPGRSRVSIRVRDPPESRVAGRRKTARRGILVPKRH